MSNLTQTVTENGGFHATTVTGPTGRTARRTFKTRDEANGYIDTLSPAIVTALTGEVTP
jgi:hypothetical protein